MSGWVYTAFITDVFARAIVSWRVSNRINTDMVIAALKQTITDRNNPEKVIHHSDHGVQYLPIRYTDKMTDSSVPVNGLYNSEVLENLKKQ